jgi:hypothetical protein
MVKFLTLYYAPMAATFALGLAYAAWHRATWNQARLGRLTTRVNTIDSWTHSLVQGHNDLVARVNRIDSLADSESDRTETRLLSLEEARMDAEALHSTLANAVGNELFALKADRDGLWKTIRLVRAEVDAGCSGKDKDKGLPWEAPFNFGEWATAKGGKAVEPISADDAGSN